MPILRGDYLRFEIKLRKPTGWSPTKAKESNEQSSKQSNKQSNKEASKQTNKRADQKRNGRGSVRREEQKEVV